jgi:hypothetical protein
MAGTVEYKYVLLNLGWLDCRLGKEYLANNTVNMTRGSRVGPEEGHVRVAGT